MPFVVSFDELDISVRYIGSMNGGWPHVNPGGFAAAGCGPRSGAIPCLPVASRPAPAHGGAADRAAAVDFRLVRNAVLSEVKRGRLRKVDVCDAHPELLRAANNVGRATGEPCQVCEDAELVHVTYVFGPRLPSHGRCVTTSVEMRRLDRRPEDLACYVVEVCPSCSWNHLVRRVPLGGRPSRR